MKNHIGFSLTQKALLSIFLILLPVFLTFVHDYYSNWSFLEKDILGDLKFRARVYGEKVSQFIASSKNRVTDYSSDGFIRERFYKAVIEGKNSDPVLSVFLKKQKLPVDKNISSISAVTTDGLVVASSDEGLAGKPLGFAISQDMSVPMEISLSTGELAIAVAAPIHSMDSGDLAGYLVNVLPLSGLERIFTEFDSAPKALDGKEWHKPVETYLVSASRLVIAATKNETTAFKGTVENKPVMECLERNMEVAGLHRNHEGVEVLGVSRCISPVNWVLISELQADEAFSTTRSMLRNAVITGITVVGLITLVFVVFFKNITGSLRKISGAAGKIAEGELKVHIPAETKDEIGMLTESFNHMARVIETRTLALQKSEEKYRSLFHDSKDVVFIITPDGKVLDINPAGLELLGYTKEELMNVDIAKGLYRNPGERDKFRQAIEGSGFVKDYETTLKNKDGHEISIILTANSILDENGHIAAYRGILRDITERKKFEHQLVQSQKMEAVGKLAAGVAHDFNNLLTGINGYGELLKNNLLLTNPSLARYAGQIIEASRKGADLTLKLLTFSRKTIANPAPFKLNGVILGMTDLLSRIIGENIKVETFLAAEDPVVLADKSQFELVLMNLATNARDAMPEGGSLVIKTEIARPSQPDGEGARMYALISMADTGKGMDATTRGRIFEPFFTTKETGKGTGLGLSIAYNIMKQHGGFINLYSEPGQGTVFNLYLPMAESAEEVKVIDTPALPTPEKGAGTILLAEDEEMIRSLIKTSFEEYGYTVIEAADGDEAVRKFKENSEKIELLIFDVIMSGKNGREAYEEIIRANGGKSVKAIFMSGYNEDIIHKNGMLENDVNFISKPFEVLELLRKARDILYA